MARRAEALATLLSLSGCQSVTDGAKEQFSRTNSCPIDRVEARPREELKLSTFSTSLANPPQIWGRSSMRQGRSMPK